jgi:hypothetical protein
VTAQPMPGTTAVSRRVRVVSCPIMAAGQRSSISFVLASLRALHIDNRKCPPAEIWHLSNDAQVHATTQESRTTARPPGSGNVNTIRTARQAAEIYPQAA